MNNKKDYHLPEGIEGACKLLFACMPYLECMSIYTLICLQLRLNEYIDARKICEDID